MAFSTLCSSTCVLHTCVPHDDSRAAVAQSRQTVRHGLQVTSWTRQLRACGRKLHYFGASYRHHKHRCNASCSLSHGDRQPEAPPYPLSKTKTVVETAMLAAVSGLAYVLSTLLRLENSLGYFLPLPVIIAAMRSGPMAGWRTMMATAVLLLVLLGPFRALIYILIHGLLAASLGTMWRAGLPWMASVLGGAVLRMLGQLAYLVLSSVTMNENLFAVMLSNVHALLDQFSAAVGASGAPSHLAVVSMIFALLLVNGICYVFLLHVIYRIILQGMGYKLGPLPALVKKWAFAGMPDEQRTTM